MKDKLEKIVQDALSQIDGTEQLEKLNEIKVAFLGKKRRTDICTKVDEGCCG